MTEQQNETQKTKPKNMYVAIATTQTVCIAVILIAVLIIKFFFGDSYKKLEKWYDKNILDQTTVSGIFDEEIDIEI